MEIQKLMTMMLIFTLQQGDDMGGREHFGEQMGGGKDCMPQMQCSRSSRLVMVTFVLISHC
jgi:hypothetical protein